MNTKENKTLYFSYEEAGLKNPLFVPSFMTAKLQVFNPDFIDRKYFTNVFRDNSEYFIVKNHIKNLMIIFILKILMILEFQRFVLRQMLRISLRLSMSLVEQHRIILMVQWCIQLIMEPTMIV